MKEYKVVVLGAGNVGKSALTIRFTAGQFHEQYDPTMEDFYRKTITVGREPAYLEILDTAGTQQFPTMLDLYIKNGQSFVIVFSLTSRHSFESIKGYKDHIMNIKSNGSCFKSVPIILVGNKCDMEQERIVSSKEAGSLAFDWGCQYIETSAKLGNNVEDVFLEAVKQLITIKLEDSSKNKRSHCMRAFLCCSSRSS